MIGEAELEAAGKAVASSMGDDPATADERVFDALGIDHKAAVAVSKQVVAALSLTEVVAHEDIAGYAELSPQEREAVRLATAWLDGLAVGANLFAIPEPKGRAA